MYDAMYECSPYIPRLDHSLKPGSSCGRFNPGTRNFKRVLHKIASYLPDASEGKLATQQNSSTSAPVGDDRLLPAPAPKLSS